MSQAGWSSIRLTPRGIHILCGESKGERLGERAELRKNSELGEPNNTGLHYVSNFAMWSVTSVR